jgi:hypothetical protein
MEFMLPTKRKSPIVQFDLNLKRRCKQGMVMIVKSNKVSRGVQKGGAKGAISHPRLKHARLTKNESILCQLIKV